MDEWVTWQGEFDAAQGRLKALLENASVNSAGKLQGLEEAQEKWAENNPYSDQDEVSRAWIKGQSVDLRIRDSKARMASIKTFNAEGRKAWRDGEITRLSTYLSATPAGERYLKDLLLDGGGGEASFEKGMDYFYGRGIPYNAQEAMAHLTEAADLGHAEAQARLGFLYREGIGTPRDKIKALEYYQKAADQGNARGQCGMGHAFSKKIPGFGQNLDEKMAFNYYKQSADQDFQQGLEALANCYEKGIGTNKDEAKALDLNQKALAILRTLAEMGDPEAQYLLGMRYHEGKGVTKSFPEAYAWSRKAAEQGDAEGQRRVGVMYQHGRGVPIDLAQAKAWMKKSADQGNETAKLSLTTYFK